MSSDRTSDSTCDPTCDPRNDRTNDRVGDPTEHRSRRDAGGASAGAAIGARATHRAGERAAPIDDDRRHRLGDDETPTPPPVDPLLGRMLATRTVLVSGEVNERLAERVMGQVLVLDAESHDPIRVVVTSQGGHVDSGFAIHDLLRYVESPVRTIGAGWVASIGVPILLSAPKEHRYSLPNTRFLLHQPSGGAGGQASDIRIAAEEILKLRERINRLIAQETGQDVERVARDSDRNFWMDASQAVEYGLVSRIVTRASEID